MGLFARSVLMRRTLLFFAVLVLTLLGIFSHVSAQSVGPFIATTTLTLSICGNAIVDDGEECDVIGETGAYSTTIIGRQCDVDCDYGPYCGDTILQTLNGEECDDGNNTSGDFCSDICKVEKAGTG